MAAAQTGDTVTIHYTGTLDDGTVFDSTREREPLKLSLGESSTILALENEIVGMEEGQTKDIDIVCKEAFGRPRGNMLRVLRRDTITVPADAKKGDRLRIQTADGKVSVVTIMKIKNGEVMVDMNHPLAGQDLHFSVELISIEEPS